MEWNQEAARQPWRWERDTGSPAHRGVDDVKQDLVAINADLSIGQPSHDGLQAPRVLLHEAHGQDGCGHLHCPQLLTLGVGGGTAVFLRGPQGLE